MGQKWPKQTSIWPISRLVDSWPAIHHILCRDRTHDRIPMHQHAHARYSQADVPPHVVRQVLQLLASRGHEPEALCRGLGFDLAKLRDAQFRVSYRQTSLL